MSESDEHCRLREANLKIQDYVKPRENRRFCFCGQLSDFSVKNGTFDWCYRRGYIQCKVHSIQVSLLHFEYPIKLAVKRSISGCAI